MLNRITIWMVNFLYDTTDAVKRVQFGGWLPLFATHVVIGSKSILLRMIHHTNLATAEFLIVEFDEKYIALFDIINSKLIIKELYANNITRTNANRPHAFILDKKIIQPWRFLHSPNTDRNRLCKILVGIRGWPCFYGI